MDFHHEVPPITGEASGGADKTMLKWMPCSGPMPAMTESKWPAATPLAQPSLRLEASTDQCQCAPQQERPLISSQHNLPGAHLGRLTQITQVPACSSRSVIAGSTSSPQRDSAWTMHRSEQKTKQSERCFAEHLSTIAFDLCCESDRALIKTSAGAVQSDNIPCEASYGVSICLVMRLKRSPHLSRVCRSHQTS